MDNDIAGRITFEGVGIDVYDSLDNPLFLLKDVAKIIGYGQDNAHKLLKYCEEDEELTVRLLRQGQIRKYRAVTEMGLYNILSQSRTQMARKWRRIIHSELINMRKEANRTIADQFEIWDERASDIWFDEETGKMMEAINGPRGDVIIQEYNE